MNRTYREFPNETPDQCRKRNTGDAIAAACFAVLFVFVIFLSVYIFGYKNGLANAPVTTRDLTYHLGPMPPETTVLAIYSNGGIITMESARLLDDGRILPVNVHGGSTYYDLMPEPLGWTELPSALVEAVR